MLSKRLLHLAQLSAVGLTGYYVGFSQRDEHKQNVVVDGKTLSSLPALPIFGTVSAATPYVETGTPKDRVSQIMKYGFPGLDNVRSYDDFVLSYDRRTRVPHWVFEHLTKQHVMKNDQVDRSKCDFMPDESIHPFFRSLNSDYKGSGFDRGHMAAAGNHKIAQRHVEQTFYLTNMAPQVGEGFNRHAWNRLEKHVRKLTNVYDNVYCCTGPLYLPNIDGNPYGDAECWLLIMGYHPLEPYLERLMSQHGVLVEFDVGHRRVYVNSSGLDHMERCRLLLEALEEEDFTSLSSSDEEGKEIDGKCYVRYQVIGANSVAVPTHFYKVVVGETPDGSLDMEAYVMPNQKIPDDTPVAAFRVPPETIERAAGLLFFDKIQRNKLRTINGLKV